MDGGDDSGLIHTSAPLIAASNRAVLRGADTPSVSRSGDRFTAEACHAAWVSGGSFPLFLMNATIFQISSSERSTHAGIPVMRTPCLVTQKIQEGGSWGMRSISCGAGGLN